MIRVYNILIVLLFLINNLQSQELLNNLKKVNTNNWLELSSQVYDDKGQIMFNVNEEEITEFPGGFDSLARFIQTNLKYPISAKNDNISGKVFTIFKVNKSGKVSNVKIYKGIRSDLDSACINTIKKLPDWKQFQLNDNISCIEFILPIHFILDKNIDNFPKHFKYSDTIFNIGSIKPINMNYDWNGKGLPWPTCLPILDSLSIFLKKHREIFIEIGCYLENPGGKHETNQKVSNNRALRNVEYLISMGVNENQVKAVGYGDSKPFVVDSITSQIYPFLKIGQKLDKEFSVTLQTDSLRDIVNKLNCRTIVKIIGIKQK